MPIKVSIRFNEILQGIDNILLNPVWGNILTRKYISAAQTNVEIILILTESFIFFSWLWAINYQIKRGLKISKTDILRPLFYSILLKFPLKFNRLFDMRQVMIRMPGIHTNGSFQCIFLLSFRMVKGFFQIIFCKIID